VLLMLLAKLLNCFNDLCVASWLAHRLSGVVGVAACAVPVSCSCKKWQLQK
jgi:hypothetical protein